MNSLPHAIFSTVCVLLLALSLPVLAQVELKTGSIYATVVDTDDNALAGVDILVESDVQAPQNIKTGPTGSFRFAQLPPGTYTVTFSLQGFTTIRQENVEIRVNSQVQLRAVLNPSTTEEVTVIGETPLVDTRETRTIQSFDVEYLQDVPSARDPWAIIDQTTGIDSDRYNVAGSESGQQASFVSRGGSAADTAWIYDGVDVTDPGALGASPTYYDFDAFEEISISTGGTGGTVVNLVTKRAGNRWEGNGSYNFVNDSLQGDNTPAELANFGAMSNRLEEVKDYGFDVGGPIVKDRVFAWGAIHRNDISLITVTDEPDKTKLTDYNFKANMNWNSAHESQFGYFNGEKEKSGRGFVVSYQAPETLWEQAGTKTITPGIWTGQHTWIPNDHTIITGRYGYIGLGFTLIPRGGKDIPIVYLSAIPRWEDTSFYSAPIDRPSHDIAVDANFFRENMLGGDHEFKFGFEYKTSKLNTFSSYGNGLLIVDYYQTTPQGPLTSGYVKAQHYIDGHVKNDRTSFYFIDTYRKDRLTLNLGFRFNRQTGKNEPSTIPAVPGFENFVGQFDYPGGDPGFKFNNVSPGLGVTYDISGDGKNVIRGNFSRYYGTWPLIHLLVNPTYVYNGAKFYYENLNGDRSITGDELAGGPYYYGGLNGPSFDLQAFLEKNLVDPNLKNSYSNEWIAGFERQISRDFAVSAQYIHRDNHNLAAILPFGVTSADFQQVGTYSVNTVLGNFSVPFYQFQGEQDGTRIYRNIDGYVQVYNGVDINARKRMSNNFMLNLGLTLQRQKAHYNSPDAAGFNIGDGGLNGQTFPFDPGQLAFLDGQPYAYASGKSGVYPYSEWNFKLTGVYQFPWDLSVGAFARYQQGYPYVIFGRELDDSLFTALSTGRHLLLLEPFGSRRFDNVFTLDLQLEKGFEFGQYGRLTLSANLFNLTNANTVTRRSRTAYLPILNNIEEVISPRALRLGVRYSF